MTLVHCGPAAGRLAELLETGAHPGPAKVGVELMADDTFEVRFAFGIARLLRLA